MFTVTLNSAGCLPDTTDDVLTFSTAREAWEYVASEINDIADDGAYLEAHTALHVTNRDAAGSVPMGGTYAFHVEEVPCLCSTDYRARGWIAADCLAHADDDA